VAMARAREAIEAGQTSADEYLGRGRGGFPRRDPIVYETRADGGHALSAMPIGALAPLATATPEPAAPAPIGSVYTTAEFESDAELLREAVANLVEPGERIVGSKVKDELERLARERGRMLYYPLHSLRFSQFADQAHRAGHVRSERQKHGDIKLGRAT